MGRHVFVHIVTPCDAITRMPTKMKGIENTLHRGLGITLTATARFFAELHELSAYFILHRSQSEKKSFELHQQNRNNKSICEIIKFQQ